MPDDPRPPAGEHGRLIDEACDRFEDGWLAGRPVALEDLVRQSPGPARPDLFRELLKIEREYRARTGRPLDTPEARTRFAGLGPWAGPIVEHLFAETGTAAHDPAGTTLPPGPGEPTGFGLQDEAPTLPGYQIGPRLGAGGMGVVYAARHLGLDLPVAVKVIRDAARVGADGLARFRAEARVVAGLSHPNLVRVYDCGEHAGCPYMAMEVVPGGTLSGRCGAPLDPREAAALVEPVARAVQHLHDAGVIHRDLKPGNILLAADGTPKVADFGLAKRLGGDDPGLTRSRVVMGTARYMAPEQAGGDSKRVGPAADVWALGVILYELLTGRPPFRDETYEVTIARILTDDPTRPSALVPGVPDALEAVCLKCLERDPGHRYASAAELAEDLRRWLDGLPTSVGSADVFEQHARWARRVGYEIEEFVSCGRWAFIYRGRHLALNRPVALRLSTGGLGTASHAAMRRRGELWAGLAHPNILHLYDYGEAHGQPYLVTELVDRGVSLSQRLGEVGGPLAPAPAAEAARQLALALQHAHEQGVIHGGLHPSEVVLTRHDVPKLAGFFLARRVGAAEPPDVDPLSVHSPHVCPPEVLAGRWAEVGPATDVYGVGVVLYTMLTGAPPFAHAAGGDVPWQAAAVMDIMGEAPSAPGVEEVRRYVLERDPDPPGRLNPAVPSALDAVCLRCLAKSPADRYGTAAGLAAELGRFLTRPAGPAPADPPPGEATIADTSSSPPGSSGPLPAGAEFRLRVLRGGNLPARTFRLPRDARFLIGRGPPACDLVLPAGKVSRVQCGVIWDSGLGQFLLIDYGGRNPTHVNGRPLRGSCALAPGDTIQVTDYQFVFEADAAA